MSVERTAANKARRAKARERWLKKRQSAEVRERMANTYFQKRPDYFAAHLKIKGPITRYGIKVTA